MYTVNLADLPADPKIVWGDFDVPIRKAGKSVPEVKSFNLQPIKDFN